MPNDENGNIRMSIDDDEMWVFAISDMPGVQLAIGRPTGEKRPAIAMWSPKRQRWHTLGRFNDDLTALAAVEFMGQMAGQINRTNHELEEKYRLQNPHQENPNNDSAT